MPKLNENRKGVSDSDAASSRVIGISILIFLFVLFAPAWLSAQESGDDPTEPIETSHESDLSGSETEDAVQGSAIEGEDAVEPSIIGDGESFQLSPVETEPEIIFDLSAGETEPDVQPEDNDFFILPEIETPDFGEIFDLSPAETEPTVFTRRPTDEYYEGIVSLAPIPDITRLGPLPQALKEGAEFTDVAADWIFHRKSAGITELRGHVMIIYDTMIISCDEAILDEKNQVYHFFGEGRTFVDDSDFMLECDELEIHDADDEKMIYIRGSSRLVIYAGEDKEEPGEDSTRRERINYALSRQDTKITFINAEYDYGKDIFIAHGRVRFEQTDKYAESDEFRGEGETDYVLFTGKCEFWQKDGEWLYEHKIIEYEEDPPSKGDRLVKALMSVPTTIMCDEAEADGSIGWLELRSFGGNVVFIRQDDKHAECEMLTLWYTEDEEETGREVEYPVNLLDEPAKEDESTEWVVPPGFGSLKLAKDFPPDYVPWTVAENNHLDEIIIDENDENVQPDENEENEENVIEESENGITDEIETNEQDFSFEFPGSEPGGIGSIAEFDEELMEEIRALPTGDVDESERQPKNELIMRGNVFIRQENGNWLFDYDVLREEEETEENIEQYRKWANGSTDLLHVWMDDRVVEATGAVSAEQDNQDLACEFLRYVGEFDMLYLRGNLAVNREGKHKLMSEEGFIFFSTKVFEALGSVQTTVMVDVERERTRQQEESSD